jgi:hypothetical protein
MIIEPCGADIPFDKLRAGSVREPKAELCSAAQTWTSGPTWFMVRVWSVLRSVLLEIFDESAYARFLARQGMTSSRKAYAGFLDEQQHLKSRRPRCC